MVVATEISGGWVSVGAPDLVFTHEGNSDSATFGEITRSRLSSDSGRLTCEARESDESGASEEDKGGNVAGIW